jgi:hypothetical protein
MRFDFEEIVSAGRFAFLTSTIVPRPTALVTTLSRRSWSLTLEPASQA